MKTPQQNAFRVALTADFYNSDGSPKYRDLGLGGFDNQIGIKQAPLTTFESKITSAQVADCNGVIVLTPSVTAETVSNSENLLAIGRFGVGYDSVDVTACTNANVAVIITAGAVDRSVAEATVGWMIALTHHMRVKDNLIRQAKWDERPKFMGSEIRDRVFGAIGFGGIARATIDLLKSFGMKQPLVYDPFVDSCTAQKYGVKLGTLEEVMASADFVSIHCPLTPKTKDLIGAKEIALMKPTAYLINTARGGIVDEVALQSALENKKIAGAALDCFVVEPLREPHKMSHLDNVLFAPHCIAWTDELFRDIGRSVCQSMIDIANGKRPHGIVNLEVFDKPEFQEKWARLKINNL
jgi:phosphoglycerate dehydrogenase-like enzyme